MRSMSFIDKLAWIRIEERKLLCARSRGKDAWFLPGGKREHGESDPEALTREIREELGVGLRDDTLQPLRTFEAQAHGQPAGVMVRMTCFTGDYEGDLHAAAEIEEIAWLGSGDREKLSLVGQIILDWLHEQGRVD